ncbi:MAG TPA: N-6 DNA methylase, partial [Acidimicrobiales bacterium]|nr:N-6 DNA methylase [Acidimicrobiales bacterium]
MTTRPPAWAAALRRAATGEGTDREALVGAVARHLARAAPPDVRDWVGDRWPRAVGLPEAVRRALPAPGAPDGPDALGLAHEALAGARERRRGVHYTPAALARRLAEVGLEQLDVGERVGTVQRISLGELAPGRGASGSRPSTVCDPACGGGAFLLAAARALADRGHDRTAILPALSGLDLDPVAARVAATALVLWAGRVAVEPEVDVGDALDGSDWPDRPEAGFDLILGNPPFQAQLGTETARTPEEAARLRKALGPAATGYVDTAALFLLAGARQVRPGGVVLLIQPQSVLASRDTAGVRSRLAEVAPLAGLWVCDEPVFEARTRVCAPVLRRRLDASRDPDSADPRPIRCWRGPAVTATPPVPPQPAAGTDPTSWAPLAAGLRDVPAVTLAVPALPEAAAASAGFRDQFYGLVPHVREATGAPAERPLITTGLIDLAGCGWGERPARYAKARWAAPVVDLETLAADDPALARWVDDRLVPKVVVATQTRVIEAVADVEGRW